MTNITIKIEEDIKKKLKLCLVAEDVSITNFLKECIDKKINDVRESISND